MKLKITLRKPPLILIFGIGVLIFLYSFLIYVQANTEQRVVNALIDEKQKSQIQSVNRLTSRLGSDLKVIQHNLEHSKSFIESNRGGYSGQELEEQLHKSLLEIDSSTITSAIIVLDKNGTITTVVSHQDDSQYVGKNVSYREYFMQTKATMQPYFSEGFVALDGKLRIFITIPISDENGNFDGLIALLLPAADFFTHYENVSDIESEYLVIFDRYHKVIIHPNPQLIGVDILDEEVQKAVKYDENLRVNLLKLFSGESVSGTYMAFGQERLASAEPVIINGAPQYYVGVVIPTSLIYEMTEDVFYQTKTITILLMVGITTSFLFVVMYLDKYKTRIENEKRKRFMVIGELTARIAHDLRNPLSVIKNTLEIIELKQKRGLYDQLPDEIERMKRSIERISHQVDDVLDYVREAPMKIEQHNMSDILGSIIEKISVPESIKLKILHSNMFLHCDRIKIEAVLTNLIVNAIQAVQGQGKIVIRATDIHNSIQIEIEDSGPGIPEDVLSSIFEPLFTTKQSGTGLGLSICKNIVEQHGGTITVKNKPTTFTVILPKNIQ
ncbi:MAG: sensor histidine kinase [Thaumarchaeota archaeon]|nr:sensor histidine kinase [Nitrososphaerota archaeon]